MAQIQLHPPALRESSPWVRARLIVYSKSERGRGDAFTYEPTFVFLFFVTCDHRSVRKCMLTFTPLPIMQCAAVRWCKLWALDDVRTEDVCELLLSRARWRLVFLLLPPERHLSSSSFLFCFTLFSQSKTQSQFMSITVKICINWHFFISSAPVKILLAFLMIYIHTHWLSPLPCALSLSLPGWAPCAA